MLERYSHVSTNDHSSFFLQNEPVLGDEHSEKGQQRTRTNARKARLTGRAYANLPNGLANTTKMCTSHGYYIYII